MEQKIPTILDCDWQDEQERILAEETLEEKELRHGVGTETGDIPRRPIQ